MSLTDLLSKFRTREGEKDAREATWYIVAAVALTSASAGDHVGELYQLATAGLDLEGRKTVQRRIKEAIVKGSILYGVPRAAGGLGPLFRVLPDDEIDTCSPRTDKILSKGDDEVRARRGKEYFDKLWGATAAQGHRDRAAKFYPDHYLLSIKTNYDLWMSEDAILSDVESQMCNTALLVCNNSPEQAWWHLRGLVRHGGTLEQARFAQELGLAVAEEFGAKTGAIKMVDDVDPNEWILPA